MHKNKYMCILSTLAEQLDAFCYKSSVRLCVCAMSGCGFANRSLGFDFYERTCVPNINRCTNANSSNTRKMRLNH